MVTRGELEQAIAAQEGLRGTIPDAVIDVAVDALRSQISALDDASEPQTQRKYVTVLFADVSGFTAMSENMDAEDVSATMNALWQQLDTIVTDQGGLVDKHIGDAIMALWGAEQAHEDDPERAIRAALAMQIASREFGESGAHPLQLRVGVNTGPVLLDQIGTTKEFTAMGDTVNTASRLEHAAPLGGVLISQRTLQHVLGVFDVIEQEPLTVKGKTEPLSTYLVERAKPRAFRVRTQGVAGVTTRMVGRGEELGQLQTAWLATLAEQRLHTVTVLGEPGVGKSRLLHEFRSWLELRPEPFWLFTGRGDQMNQTTPMYLVQELLRTRFQITENDPPAVLWQKMEAGIGEIFPDTGQAEGYAHLIGQFVGYDFNQSPHVRGIREDGQQIAQRGATYLLRYFEQLCRHDPVVILLEDIHWADSSSLTFITRATEEFEALPLMIVALSRPAPLDLRPGWGRDQSRHSTLSLSNLTERDSRELAAEVLQRVADLPSSLRDMIAAKAEGNPYYIEEFVKMLLDEGVILRSDDRWQIDGSALSSMKVPETLVGVLQAQVDVLDPDLRHLLQQASIIGRIFWDGVVAELWDRERPDDPYEMLDALQQREFVDQSGDSTFAELEEYLFHHSLLREVVYESVLKRDRRLWHSVVADWLIAHVNERDRRHTSLVARQLELAGRWREAVAYHQMTAELAYYAGHYDVGRQILTRSLDLAADAPTDSRPTPLQVTTLRFWLGRTLHRLGSLDLASATFGAALPDARAIGDFGLMARLLAAMTWLSNDQGLYEQATEQGTQAVAAARRSEDKGIEVNALSQLGFTYLRRGEWTDAEPRLLEAAAVAQNIGADRELAYARNGLATIAYYRKDHDSCGAAWRHCLDLARALGDDYLETMTLANMGELARIRGDLDQALAFAQQALTQNRKAGRRNEESLVLVNLGHAQRDRGLFDESLRTYRECVMLAHDVGVIGQVLEGVIGWASVQAQVGGTAPALASLGVVDRHPQADENSVQELASVLSILNEMMDETTVTAGMAAGASLTLDDVVAEIVGEDPDDH